MLFCSKEELTSLWTDNLLCRVIETDELLTKKEALVSAQELEEQKKVIQNELKQYERQREYTSLSFSVFFFAAPMLKIFH